MVIGKIYIIDLFYFNIYFIIEFIEKLMLKIDQKMMLKLIQK
jgi:hypothetical protein